MINLTKKALLISFIFMLFSCENENTSTSDPDFFNLNIGNKWVYKKYENSPNSPEVFTFSGIVDTVKIVSIETSQGFTFAKKSSQKVNTINGTISPITYSYVRVNNLGHLVEITSIENSGPLTETYGLVLHPGLDQNYFYNQSWDYGSIEHHLYSATNQAVEGNNYLVYPYKGVFTPSPNFPDLVSKTTEFNYQQNIGLVKQVCHAVFGNYTWEERLVSYELK